MRLLPHPRTRPGRLWSRAVTTLCVLAAVPVLGGVSTAAAAVDVARPVTRPVVEAPLVGDDHPGVLERRRRDARDLAVQGLLEGRIAASAAGSVELPGGPRTDTSQAPALRTTPYAETALLGSDRVLGLLVDFGPGDYADRTWNGPVHGDVAPDDGAQRYERLLFDTGPASLRSYLLDQSGGRYTIDGTVQDWVGVPYNAARYGVDACGGAECPDRVADFVSDAVDAFVADFYARDPAGDLAAFLAPYDQRDRYDGDADGDFTEPDGYLDHIVLVFAGGSQLDTADTDLMQSGFGSVAGDAPSGGPNRNPYGGHQLGASGIWVDAFTAVPEDVDLGTLVHTFGHDLGLPDLADAAGQAQVDSSVQFWSPMAGGSRLDVDGAAAVDGASGTPGQTAAAGGRRAGIARAMAEVGVPDLLAAEKLQLGWVDYEVVTGSTPQTVQLADSSGTPVREPDAGAELSAATEAAVVPLGPLASTSRLATPAVGARSFGSTVGPSSRAELVVPLDGAADRVTWRQWTDVEPVFDTLHVEASVAGAWADVAPVTSGASEWISRSAPLPAGAQLLRFSYRTDHVATGAGVLVDDIRLSAAVPEGAEQGLPAGWTATGWAAVDGTSTSTAPGFYIAERRDLAGYDASLLTAPYVANPRRGTTAVDRFGYDGGVLVSFWDGRAADNAVSAHPGSGRLLVVDARPDPTATTSGAPAPLGLHPFDAAFGTSWLRGFAVDGYSVTAAGEITAERVRVRAQPPVPGFDDTDPRYAAGTPGQPRLPGLGVRLTVQDEGASVTSIQLAGAPTGSVATGSVASP